MIRRDRLLAVADRHHAALLRNARSLPEVLAAEGLEPATDALAHWAHWVTPASRSKRFDTQFFLAAAPPDQLAVHDGWSWSKSVWIAPAQAVAEADAGKRRLVFATRKNLEKLARHATVADALAACRAATGRAGAAGDGPLRRGLAYPHPRGGRLRRRQLRARSTRRRSESFAHRRLGPPSGCDAGGAPRPLQ